MEQNKKQILVASQIFYVVWMDIIERKIMCLINLTTSFKPQEIFLIHFVFISVSTNSSSIWRARKCIVDGMCSFIIHVRIVESLVFASVSSSAYSITLTSALYVTISPCVS